MPRKIKNRFSEDNVKRMRWLLSLPVILFSIAIFIASAQETVEFIDLHVFGVDKILHFSAYFVFGLFLQLFVHANFHKFVSRKKIYLIILIGFLYSISDEVHQYFVPGRSADYNDLVADFAGILFSLIFYRIIYEFFHSRKIIK